MPLFDFRCETCKAEWEDLVKHDEPNPVCETCGTRWKVVKLISAPASQQMQRQ